MGAGTSPADPATEADRTSPAPSAAEGGQPDAAVKQPDTTAKQTADASGPGSTDGTANDGTANEGTVDESADGGAVDGAGNDGTVSGAGNDDGAADGTSMRRENGASPSGGSVTSGSTSGGSPSDDSVSGDAKVPAREGDAAADEASADVAGAGERGAARRSRRFPSFTRDTARPEGGGRAASGDAPAPARQWPLLAVLCTAGIGLLIVATDPFAEAFRVGTILIGAALLGGAVLRLVVPSVGMLAVRSRFTDLVTYGLLGFLIVMLALVAQPKPWLDIPFLEDAVHFTIR
ncbi:DUF3017 domain-containing protein [Streptomyces sp. NPDC056061]|uniref:DUF3017 domain-containing protein n=1 Tax=Streptomyces sp. NPDC056061 TaxID=3345700 RepID=UPI0035DE36DD